MDQPPTTTALSSKANISIGYASDIINGNRKPSRGLAVRIYRATGWRPSILAALSEDDIDTLERIEGARL